MGRGFGQSDFAAVVEPLRVPSVIHRQEQ